MTEKFKAIEDRNGRNFNFSEEELRRELTMVSQDGRFWRSTRETAEEILQDTTGRVWFSGFDLCDPAWRS